MGPVEGCFGLARYRGLTTSIPTQILSFCNGKLRKLRMRIYKEIISGFTPGSLDKDHKGHAGSPRFTEKGHE